MGLVERVTGFYRRISDKPATNQAKPEPTREVREIKRRRSRKIRKVTRPKTRPKAERLEVKLSPEPIKPTEPTNVQEVQEPSPTTTRKILSGDEPKPQPETITDEEFNTLVEDLPPKRKERILKDYEKARETGGQITIIEGEAPHATARVVHTSLIGPIIAREKEKLSEESVIYESGERIRETGKSMGEGVKSTLPLENLPGGGIAEEFAAGIVELPFRGIGSMVQSFAFYELKAKGKEPTPYQWMIIGQRAKEAHELQMESLAMEGVGKIARTAIGKPIEFVRFRGKEYVPPEKVIKEEVLEGKEIFPSPKIQEGSALVEEFKTSPYTQAIESEVGPVRGFHATAQAGGIRGTGKGLEVHDKISRPHDMPGMYMAPSISPYFLRISDEAVEYTLLPRFSFRRPGVILAGVKDVRRLPEPLRRDIPKAQKFMLEEAEEGVAYVTPEFELGKPEAEAVIAPGTEMINIRGSGLLGGKFKYYTEWKGKKIPIYELQAKTKVKAATEAEGEILVKIKKSGKTGKTVEEYIEEYAFKPERRAIYSPDKYLGLEVSYPLRGSKSETLTSRDTSGDFSSEHIDDLVREILPGISNSIVEKVDSDIGAVDGRVEKPTRGKGSAKRYHGTSTVGPPTSQLFEVPLSQSSGGSELEGFEGGHITRIPKTVLGDILELPTTREDQEISGEWFMFGPPKFKDIVPDDWWKYRERFLIYPAFKILVGEDKKEKKGKKEKDLLQLF